MGNFEKKIKEDKELIVYVPQEGEMTDVLGCRMFSECDIPGTVKFSINPLTGAFEYDCDKLISLSDILEKEVTKGELLRLFKSVYIIIDSMASFLLDESQLLLDISKIYVDGNTGEFLMMYIPILDFTQQFSDEDFVRKVVFSARFNPDEDGSYIMRIINYLNSRETFDRDKFIELIDELEHIHSSYSQKAVVKMPQPVESISAPMPQMDTVPLDDPFGETVVLSEYMNNSVQQNQMAYLIRKNNGEKITLGKEIFKLGKERKNVDYCISDNKVISRHHADVVNDNGHYYLIDNNSLNHTYLNGKMLSGSVRYPLNNNDEIKLADEEFVINGI